MEHKHPFDIEPDLEVKLGRRALSVIFHAIENDPYLAFEYLQSRYPDTYHETRLGEGRVPEFIEGLDFTEEEEAGLAVTASERVRRGIEDDPYLAMAFLRYRFPGKYGIKNGIPGTIVNISIEDKAVPEEVAQQVKTELVKAIRKPRGRK